MRDAGALGLTLATAAYLERATRVDILQLAGKQFAATLLLASAPWPR